jgi:murein DD-endopeptidase MepM/ murein hydrolase activator NlpD
MPRFSDLDAPSRFSTTLDFRILGEWMRLAKGSTIMLLLLACAGLTACDVVPGLQDETPKPPSDSLRFSYSPLNENAQNKAGEQPPSPYHCLTSVRTPDGPHRYRYQKVYLLYPESLLEDAPERVMHQTYRLHAQANSGGNESERPIQRLARCRLPATPQAAGMLHEALRYHGEGSVIDLTEDHERHTNPQKDSSADPTAKSLTDDELEELWEWARENNMSCVKHPYDGPGTGGFKCYDREVVITGEDPGIPGGEPDFGPPGSGSSPWGGSGSSSGGNVPLPCLASREGTYDLCDPVYPDVEEDRLCPKDPLKDMDIRSTCSGVEGGRFGENARGEGNPHYGIDLLAEIGTSTTALRSGRVYGVNRDQSESDFGKYVIIQSGENLIIYAHLSKVSVNGGDEVTLGETKVGETGVTGNACENSCSCGPSHLHLGVKKGNTWGSGTPKDPEETVLGTEFNQNGDPISDDCSPVFKEA